MGRVERADSARDDLRDIWLFIAEDSIEAADRVLDRLEEAFVMLSQHPRMGRERAELGANLRSFVVAPFTVFYVPLEDGVAVARVLHNRRDTEAEF